MEDPWLPECAEQQIDDGGGESGGSPDTPSLTQWTGWIGYNVTFSVTCSSDGSYVASDFSSNLVGFTLGVSWTPGSSSYTSSPDSSTIYFSVTGYQNYNIFVEGLGTVFSQPVTIAGSYDVDTGTYSMTVE